METLYEQLLTEIEVLEPVGANGFQVFGLRRKSGNHSALSYLTLDEALQQNLVDVTEIDESGSVPTLKVSNKAEDLLFLMAGEQLQGAKQNRVLNVSIMVNAMTEIPIPVSCVEAGRWRYRSRKFGSAHTQSHRNLRAMMAKDITASYRAAGTPVSKQGAVWDEISRKLGEMGSYSDSSALNQVYEDYESKLQRMTDDLKLPAGSSGAVFVFHGRIAGMDLFAQSATFEKLWPKLVRSYAIDAMGQPVDSGDSVTHEAVAKWLRTSLETRAERFRSPGMGEDLRLEGEHLAGSSLLVDNEVIHTELFSI